MSDVTKIIIREQAKLERQEEAVRITRAHIEALTQLSLNLQTEEAEASEAKAKK